MSNYFFRKRKTSQKKQRLLAVCLMLVTFLQEVMYAILHIRLPAGWLQNYFNTDPDAKYIRPETEMSYAII